MSIAYAIGILIFSYVAGSIPTGYWLVKSLKGIDIRTIGSGSTGATNVLRSAGKGAALFTLVFDVFKGYVPVMLAVYLEESVWSTLPFNYPNTIPTLVAIIAIVGHSKSIFLGFSGGKSAATTLGTLYGLNPAAASLTFGLWIAIVYFSKIVSLASIIAALACPLFMFICGAPPAVLIFSLVACVYVVARHKDNIKRLMAGTESKIGSKATVPPAGAAVAEPAASDSNPEKKE
jgi:glycerol-3-phosphate acyltransferase PlsY